MEKIETNIDVDSKGPGESLNNDGVLDQVIVTKGYDQGTLFHSSDRSTYTFLHENDVIALHFDFTRELLYLKGHKITNLSQHPSLGVFLQRFEKVLVEHKVSSEFLECFRRVLGRIA